MKKMILVCGLLAASCGTPGAVYVKADRETFDALTPSYTAYVIADPALTQEQKDRRLLVVETWRQRLEAAEVSK